MQIQGGFDANQFAPKQVGDVHPAGKFPAQVTNTSLEPVKDNPDNAGMYVVEFTTPAGSIAMRYNLWNPSAKAVEIAQNQLSALCHATGVFKLNWPTQGAEMRGARCMIEVVDQLDNERKPNGYTKILKVYDMNGNEPGKAPTNAPQANWQPAPGAQAAPAAQQPQGGWAQSVQQPQTPIQQAPNPTTAPSSGWQQQTSNAPAQNFSAPPWAQNR